MKKIIFLILVPLMLSAANQWKDKDKIIMLGDSITYRYNWEKVSKNKLTNRGVNGDTTAHVLRRIQGSKPKQVFLMIGINDFFRGRKVNDVFEDYKKILSYYKEKNIPVVIESTLYISNNQKLKHINKNVKELNDLLKNYAKENKLQFLDLNFFFAPLGTLEKTYTNDGLHLKLPAYELWQQAIQKYL